jgi:succinoglycan biosynthesis protein ExoM
MHWEECRTGNVLFRRSLVAGDVEPFLEQFGTGGEDKDFFMRMAERGHVFRWCNEGIAYETVPPDRWTRQYMLRRALLRGNNILKHPGQRLRLLAKSALAAPAYSLLLPLTLPFGQHVFMRYCIRFCDHAGRLLGALGVNPVKAR